MTLPSSSPAQKAVILGTALWGWGVDRKCAHDMLDRYVELGGCIVDTAENYPINKTSGDFGLAATWIADWIRVNGTERIAVLVKVGATDNSGGANSDLRPSSILNAEAHFRELLGVALAAVAIHWDNRGDIDTDFDAICDTVSTFATLREQGLSIGFSGVRRPDLYFAAAPELSKHWWIQVKENIATSASRTAYSRFFPEARYLAYGINMGGVKSGLYGSDCSLALRGINHPARLANRLAEFLDSNHRLDPAPRNLNDLALLVARMNPALSGIIIGPRNVEQLESSIDFWIRSQRASTISVESMLPDLGDFL